MSMSQPEATPLGVRGLPGRSARGRAWVMASLLALVPGLGWIPSARAQPAVGTVFQGTVPTEAGFDIPLPASRWRLTHVTEQRFPDYSIRILVLRSEQAQASVPYLTLRYSLQNRTWSSPCDLQPGSSFFLDRFGTLSNQLLGKCSRNFVAGLPRATATDPWWKGVDPGVEPADAELLKEAFVMSELTVLRWRGSWVRVEAFVRTRPTGVTAAAVRDAALAGQYTPWGGAIEAWNRRYVAALEEALVNRKASPIASLEAPTSGAVDDKTRQRAEAGGKAPPSARPPAATPPLSDRELVERIRQMAEAGQDPSPLPASPVATTPAASVARPVNPPVTPAATTAAAAPATVPAAPPGVTAGDLARLAAEVARLRDELKTRPAAPAATEPAPPRPPATAVASARRLALVIGNDGYQSVSRLQNARADARTMAELLGKAGYRVRLRLDLSERAMKDELRAFKGEVQGGDEVLFYFAGHGVQLAGANYLLPTDVRSDSEDQVRDDALPLQKVLDDLQERKARFALAIVDACRDNPFKGAGRNIGTRGLAPTSAATGQMVMFSAGAGQQALDRLGDKDNSPNGLFTRVLVKEMGKPGLSVDRVLRNVRTQVVDLARSVGHEQVPALYDQTVGEFFFQR